jgi:hypothetical protein
VSRVPDEKVFYTLAYSAVSTEIYRAKKKDFRRQLDRRRRSSLVGWNDTVQPNVFELELRQNHLQMSSLQPIRLPSISENQTQQKKDIIAKAFS